jgi:hypothetical protein
MGCADFSIGLKLGSGGKLRQPDIHNANSKRTHRGPALNFKNEKIIINLKK